MNDLTRLQDLIESERASAVRIALAMKERGYDSSAESWNLVAARLWLIQEEFKDAQS